VVGEEAAGAAWLHAAMLDDRVRSYEGQPQLYGTPFDWDEAGTMSPLRIDDPGLVDERRRALGLGSLSEEIERRREAVETAPPDWHARQRELDEWLRRVGWR
jgi:hypothetical protein